MKHEMVSMKLPKKKRRRSYASPVSSLPEYPWGTTITLENDALKKLGITDLPEIGEEVMLHGMGKVTRLAESSSAVGKDNKSVEIQLTRMEVAFGEDAEDEHDSLARGYAKVRGPKV